MQGHRFVDPRPDLVRLPRSTGAIPSTRPPAVLTASTVSALPLASRSHPTTSAPSRAKRRAAARPKPLAVPVISATLRSSRPVTDPPYSCLAARALDRPAGSLPRPERLRVGSFRSPAGAPILTQATEAQRAGAVQLVDSEAELVGGECRADRMCSRPRPSSPSPVGRYYRAGQERRSARLVGVVGRILDTVT
jgi:hypothetical protein